MRASHFAPAFRKSRIIVSRWTPVIRSVLRIDDPSVRSDKQSVAFSISRRRLPKGRSGMMPNVFRHALHFRRELPSLSLPHPMVAQPKVRQGVTEDRDGASMGSFSLDLGLLYAPGAHMSSTF